MKQNERQWLGDVSWDAVLNVNQTLCQAQKIAHQLQDNNYEKARQLWEKSVPRRMSLDEVLELCRQCHELSPFTFNNGNTFAAVGKTFVEDWVKSLPSVEAQVVRTTVAHFVAGQIGKKELIAVLRHFETTWTSPETVKPVVQPLASLPRVESSAS